MAATLPPSILLSSSQRTPSTSSSSSSGRGSHSRDPSAPQQGVYSPDTAAALAGMGVLSAGVGTPSVATRSSLNHTPTSSGSSRSQAPVAPSSSGIDPTLQGSRSSTNQPHHRKRSSSIVMVQKIEQSPEELLDQSAGFNANADWVNAKGAWLIHVLLIFLGKIMLDVVPGMQQDLSWTIVNLGYIAVSYLMFHHVTGTPFESNAGVYDQLTLWEQIDEGAQYTPAKKWLTSLPIGLFLISTHYTKYNLGLFALNFGATVFVLCPKLPILHRLRFVFGSNGNLSQWPSGANSPYPSRPNTPAVPESYR